MKPFISFSGPRAEGAIRKRDIERVRVKDKVQTPRENVSNIIRCLQKQSEHCGTPFSDALMCSHIVHCFLGASVLFQFVAGHKFSPTNVISTKTLFGSSRRDNITANLVF